MLELVQSGSGAGLPVVAEQLALVLHAPQRVQILSAVKDQLEVAVRPSAAAVRLHARSILIFLARRTCDPETALDLAAETFAQAFESRRRFRGSTDEDAAAWFFAIARNVLSRYVRRGAAERRALTRLGVEVPSLEPDDLARIVELAGLDDLRGVVAREMGALTEEHRDALQLRVVEQLPYGDVAQRLAITETTARARVSRGLRTIGRAIDPTTIHERLT